jgi:HSP90 family molecular chaperone
MQALIKQYSEFIAFPIKLWTTSSTPEQVGRVGAQGVGRALQKGRAGAAAPACDHRRLPRLTSPHPPHLPFQVVDEEATAKAQEEADKEAAEEGKESAPVAPGARA